MMRSVQMLGLGVFLAMPLYAQAQKPVAIVYSLAGEASMAAPGEALRPLRLFDRLPAGTALEVGPGSRVALAFVNGRRYELGERSRVMLRTKDLASRSGTVRALLPVPPLPGLSPIAAEDRPGARAGAVRIRAERIGLFPRDGAVTLAETTLLHFQAVNGAARYRVEIEDVRGTVVFHVVTDASPVSVPAGILAPGARYHWTAKALDRPGPVVRGEADFVTLSRKEARSRERIRKALEPVDDDSSRALLAAVDHVLGLRNEDPGTAGLVIESVTPEPPGAQVDLQPGDRILSWSCIREKQVHPSDLRFAEKSCQDFRQALMEMLAPEAFWVNPHRGRWLSRNKILQQQAAIEVGLRTPRSLYTNDPGRIRRFIRQNGGVVAFKPLYGLPWKSDEFLWMPYTQELREDQLVDDKLLRVAPGIYQELVPKSFELRITIMGRSIFAAKINSQNTERGRVDWRRDNNYLQMQPYELPGPIAESSLKLMRKLGLAFGCLDFIVTPEGSFVFLEVNQMGQFLFVELKTGIPLVDAFSDFLLSGSEDFVWSPSGNNFDYRRVQEVISARAQSEISCYFPAPDSCWQE